MFHAKRFRLFSQPKLACLPTQRDLTRVALLALVTGAIIVLFGIGAFVR
jgi:hypothetical protein